MRQASRTSAAKAGAGNPPSSASSVQASRKSCSVLGPRRGLLRLIFTACHPVLSQEAQVALTLRLLGRLCTADIARACLLPDPTIAKRSVRLH